MPKNKQDKQAPQHQASQGGLPLWLTSTVVLVLLGLLSYNIVVVGPEGLPTSYILGGLLGAYAGVDQLLKRRSENNKPDSGDSS